MIGRVRDSGVEVLVYTVDIPGEAKRERDLRNGFDLPLAITPRLVADVLGPSELARSTIPHSRPAGDGELAPYPGQLPMP